MTGIYQQEEWVVEAAQATDDKFVLRFRKAMGNKVLTVTSILTILAESRVQLIEIEYIKDRLETVINGEFRWTSDDESHPSK